MKRIFAIILMIATVLCSLCGCSDGVVISGNVDNLEEMATFYDNAHFFMKEDFLKNNITRSAMQGALDDKYYVIDEEIEKILPSEIPHFVETKRQFEKMFESFPEEVDFRKEILYVHIYTEFMAGTPLVLKKASLKNEELILYCALVDWAKYSGEDALTVDIYLPAGQEMEIALTVYSLGVPTFAEQVVLEAGKWNTISFSVDYINSHLYNASSRKFAMTTEIALGYREFMGTENRQLYVDNFRMVVADNK